VASDRDQAVRSNECRKARQQLGAEPDRPSAEASAHLGQCEPCRAEARRLGAVWALLNVVDPVDPSPDFARRVWAKIAAEPSGTPISRWGGLPAWSLRWVAVALVIALAIAVVTLWHLDRPEHPEVAAQLDLVESPELLANFDVVENLDVLLLVEDP